MKTFLAITGTLAVALMLAGCGSHKSSSKAPAPPAPTGSSYPYTNPIKAEGSSPPRLAGDGRYFGYIRAANAESHTISFDVAQFFFGKDVQKAAEDDGAVAPGESVSNDHYERNRDHRSVALDVAPDTEVTVGAPASFLLRYVSRRVLAKCEATSCTQISLPLATFFAATKDLNPRYGDPVWVTILDGRVVRIDEQYFP